MHHKEIELTFDEKIEEYFQTIAPSANEANISRGAFVFLTK